jgi:cell division protein FtsW (lipid II flippase)
MASVPALLVITWMVNTRSTRMSRITVWLHPDQADPLGNGLQALHGKFALASGGWWGVGLGGSKEKWGALPEAHTDFIFAIIGEELGLVGTLAVLGLFGVIGYAGLRVALEATEPFVRYAAAGITAWVIVQALVNIGAVLGLLPITGVPLPLVSYGGSRLVPTMLGLGMLLSFARPRGVRRRRRLLRRLARRQAR